MKTRFAAMFLLILLLAGLCMQPVYANSAQRNWSGTDSTGAVVTGEDCPIVVDRELLYFDVQEFPEQYYPDTEAFLAYTGKVTAEYTFRNPADYTVTATLVFPFGSEPSYGERIYNMENRIASCPSDTEKYGVTIDGAPVDAAVRHTLKAWRDQFSLEEDLSRLADDYISDAFFTPEMSVWIRQYIVRNIDSEYESATAVFTWEEDASETRVMFPEMNGYQSFDDGFQASTRVQNGDTLTLYIFGKLPIEPIHWALYEDFSCKKRIDGEVAIAIESSERISFERYVLNKNDGASGIADHDFYNAQVEYLRSASEAYGSGFINCEDKVFSLMRWYEYTVTLEPGQTITNTVTAPLYPAIDAGYTPSIYEYTYLLSPAKTWAKFGALDIVINTPYYMTECGIDGFNKTDSGYALSMPGLPEGELTFTLSESEKPQQPRWSFLNHMPTDFIIVLAVVLAAVGVVVSLLLRRKRRMKK